MHEILVPGAGKIGALISGLLAENGGYRIQLADSRKRAAGVCSIIDIVLADPTQYHGFVAQEKFRPNDILDNRFGACYAHGGNNVQSAELVARGDTGHQRVSAGE